MQVYPLLNIRFPEQKEPELVDAMRRRAAPPSRWRPYEPVNCRVEEGEAFFRRDAVGADPPCILYLCREGPGNWAVTHIQAECEGVHFLALDEYVAILRDFDVLIAEPAAEELGGMTSIDTTQRSLEDYFPAEAVRLLKLFCTTSNKSDLGSHPSDQRKWIAFLLCVYFSRAEVDCDTFGQCLHATGWWPEDHILTLVNEYELAMRLLEQAEGRMPRVA
jgi:hypothetical protein